MLGRCTAFAILIVGTALVPAAYAQQAGAQQTAPQAAAAPDLALIYTQPLGADAVQQVKTKLTAFGAYSGTVDGKWSADDEAALRQFQQTHGLQPTGQMNQATAATMGLDPAALLAMPAAAPAATPAAPATAAAPAAAAPPPSPNQVFSLSTDSVRLIQTRLRQLGFYTDAIDGVWGAGSLAALRSFQGAHGLPPDGRLTAETVRAMGIDPAAMQPQ